MASLTPVIAVHLAAAVPALALGGWILARPKGTRGHRALGRAWVVLIAVAALSSFWIQSIEAGAGYSPIHLLSIWTLLSLVVAVVAIRRGRVRQHKAWMIGTFGGLVVAGLLAFAPGRLLSSLY